MHLIFYPSSPWTEEASVFLFMQARDSNSRASRGWGLSAILNCQWVPGYTTFIRWIQLVGLRCGISSEVFDMLRIKVGTFANEAKDSVLMFDEMAINKWLL
jgi:Transposase protein